MAQREETEKISPNRGKGNAFSFLLHCSESVSPCCSDSSPCPGMTTSFSTHGPSSSSPHPQHLPRDTRAEGSDNLSLRKESSQEADMAFHLFWSLYPNPILAESQFSIEFCWWILASFPTIPISMSTLSPSSTSQVHLHCSSLESAPQLSHCTVTSIRKWQCSVLDLWRRSLQLAKWYRVTRARWGSVLYLKENSPYIHKNRTWDVKLEYISALQTKLKRLSINFMYNFPSHPSTLNSSLILISSFYQYHVKHTHLNKSIWFLR